MASDARGDLLYASEKLGTACQIMATTEGRLRDRVFRAWVDQGHRAAPMGPGQAGVPMSEDLADRITAFSDRMSREPARADEGTIRATIDAMTDEEVADVADQVWSLWIEVLSELDEHWRSRN